jgi:hypothetical protein
MAVTPSIRPSLTASKMTPKYLLLTLRLLIWTLKISVPPFTRTP